ncbi:hypothetical protein ACFFJY_17480 [Fictibacillus aquaticus]|uniref:Uncharacterized protein n=1 Tax=Fictibacillus aquaticus TaxID=2021314 RepID=A0A235F6G3_9BACL|nr:hypothetical protein [Fictibacillus aquaticus]OYD56663.1 hypothetical protein CGZ90_16775 [Fictibacillus aquaticus]
MKKAYILLLGISFPTLLLIMALIEKGYVAETPAKIASIPLLLCMLAGFIVAVLQHLRDDKKVVLTKKKIIEISLLVTALLIIPLLLQQLIS